MKPIHVRIAPGVVRVFSSEEEYQAWAKVTEAKYLIHPALGITLLIAIICGAAAVYHLLQ